MPDYPLTIPFKNIFLDVKTFEYIVDPTVLFATSSSSNVINSKQVRVFFSIFFSEILFFIWRFLCVDGKYHGEISRYEWI